TTENRLNNDSRLVLFNQFEEEQHQLNEDDASDSFSQMMEDMHINAAAKKQSRLEDANSRPFRSTKLSELQKEILEVALRWHGKDYSDVCNADVKAQILGWPVEESYSRWSPDCGWYRHWEPYKRAHPGTARYVHDSRPVYGQIFCRNKIGIREYNKGSVTVTRALKRLGERNLLCQTGRGWSLTSHGLEVVKTAARATEV
ncbi:MAG: hypothetical protein O7E52_10170, partial [Candidatus Poribacteria bacterium]|nr:hypothetical protein [Candidatus Poribacteria bacterium]